MILGKVVTVDLSLDEPQPLTDILNNDLIE